MDNIILQIILALLGGGGLLTILGLLLRAFFEKEVKKAVNCELTVIRQYLVDLKIELNQKQTKEICGINHENIERRLDSIETKLDRLIEMRDIC